MTEWITAHEFGCQMLSPAPILWQWVWWCMTHGSEVKNRIYTMSDKDYKRKKEALEEAKKARNKCTAFKWMTIATGAVAVLIGVFAAICPPPWEVHDSIIKLIGEFIGIIAIFAALTAFESGRDAKIKLHNLEMNIDGDGDGKVDIKGQDI